VPSTRKQFLTLFPERVADVNGAFVNYGPHSPQVADAWGKLYELVHTVTGMGSLQFERHKRRISRVYMEHLILQQKGVAIHENPHSEERTQVWRLLMDDTVEVTP